MAFIVCCSLCKKRCKCYLSISGTSEIDANITYFNIWAMLNHLNGLRVWKEAPWFNTSFTIWKETHWICLSWVSEISSDPVYFLAIAFRSASDFCIKGSNCGLATPGIGVPTGALATGAIGGFDGKNFLKNMEVLAGSSGAQEWQTYINFNKPITTS